MYAKQLDGTHIGMVVVFETTEEPSGVELTVRGELREVAHKATSKTDLYLTGLNRAEGYLTSLEIPRDTFVTVYNAEGKVIG